MKATVLIRVQIPCCFGESTINKSRTCFKGYWLSGMGMALVVALETIGGLEVKILLPEIRKSQEWSQVASRKK